MSTWELIIFISAILLNTFVLFMWLYKKRKYKSGEFYNTAEVVTLYTLPRVVFVLYIVLLIFYLTGLDKLHLLYIFPIIYFIINYKMAGRITEEDRKLRKEKLIKF